MESPAWKQTAQVTCWLFLAVIMLVFDYLPGPFIRFPIMYLVPIVLASWKSGLRWGVAFAVCMPLVHLSFSEFWITPFTFLTAGVNTLIRIATFVGFAYLVNKVSVQKQQLEKEVQTLQGILPICSFCKRIRNQAGTWEPLEAFIAKRSEAEFSHGMCPDCAKKNYPDFY